MKKLLINGCSHTSGIQGPSLEYKPHSFDDYFKSYDTNNIAIGGNSNFAIFKSTIEYCERHDVDLVIIGWTTHERFEFNYDEGIYQYSLGKQSDNPELQKFFKFADLHMTNWNVGLYNLLIYQISLQEYFKSKNIDYIYCNMYNAVPKDCHEPLWNSIDTSKYYMPHDSFIERYLELYPEGFDKSKHISHQLLYKRIAEELMEFLEK